MSESGRSNGMLVALVLIVAILVGGFVFYQNQQNDIEIELPDVDINN